FWLGGTLFRAARRTATQSLASSVLKSNPLRDLSGCQVEAARALCAGLSEYDSSRPPTWQTVHLPLDTFSFARVHFAVANQQASLPGFWADRHVRPAP